jgi:hypothetical protein
MKQRDNVPGFGCKRVPRRDAFPATILTTAALTFDLAVGAKMPAAMIRPIRKAAATFSLIVVIALAGFSLSLAHESARFGPSHYTGSRCGFPP